MSFKEELEHRLIPLPLRARVAFSVRCAMRLEPMVPEDERETISEALWCAREFAEKEVDEDFRQQIANAVKAIELDSDQPSIQFDVAYIASAAHSAHTNNDGAEFDTVNAGINAAFSVANTIGIQRARSLVFADLATLEAAHLSDDDYVPQSIFGVMWPDGEPEWPAELDILIDPGDSSPALIAKILLSLSDLHEAEGGSGLSFDGIEEFEIAKVLT